MRFAKTVTALALACSLALAIPTFAAPAAEEQAGRQEDLELLYQTIRDRHPGPFTNTPEQEFLARIAQIEARIDTEDSMSFGLDLQSLAALIGDSHTTTNLNSILSSGHMFPVSVKWMDGDWVLYQVDASHQGALGQQVTSVNGFSMDQVQVVVQPQSVIHSMVQFDDGAVIAQLGTPDMKLPIQYALYYPERRFLAGDRLDFWSIGQITFEKPDMDNFPGLSLAYEAGRTGGTMPTVFNAANERAVAKFLNREISYLTITDMIEGAMKGHTVKENPSVDEILEAEASAYDYIESRW